MQDRAQRLIQVMNKIKKAHNSRKNMLHQLNSSELGVCWCITKMAEKNPNAKLFSLNEINNYLKFTKPNLSQTVNKLEDKGIVHRVISKENRRATYLEITPEGEKMAKEHNQKITAYMTKVTDMMGEEDAEKLIHLLDKFADILEQIDIE